MPPTFALSLPALLAAAAVGVACGGSPSDGHQATHLDPPATGGTGGGASASTGGNEPIEPVELVDDWAYEPADMAYGGGMASGAALPMAAPTAGGSTGLAVGGAMDANNFRQNIENGYLPLETDITHEGLYYGYFFDRGQTEPCTELFCPTYSQMRSTDILTTSEQDYLSVGLSSGLTEADTQRKKLNLVIVLDISGSMSSSFDSYYYDSYGNLVTSQEVSTKTKMALANESVVAMMDHLSSGDRFGMVLFDDVGYLAKPLSPVDRTDMAAIAAHVLELAPQGGTNMEAGFRLGTETLAAMASDADPSEYENRIIFLTDAMPNLGDLSESSLLGMVGANADSRMYTSFIGIGVDFNTELIEALSKVPGANYYSVHTEGEFNKRMDEEFEYMVTPLVFNLELQFESEGFEIEAVYGSPEADQATGTLMRVNTLFPSASEGGETKGGIVLLKLRRIGDANGIVLSATYEDRNGNSYSTRKSFDFNAALGVAPNTGIQKAILLSRYVNLMKAWIVSERQAAATADPALSDWERTSLPLTVSEAYRTTFQTFLQGFTAEADRIGDPTLAQEQELLQSLIEYEASASTASG